jgi:hypothetical protein
MKYRQKPVVIEAITFDEFVEYGKMHSDNIVNGMPWSFEYKGHSITHEHDSCYLISTLNTTMKFTPDDMMMTDEYGDVYPCHIELFKKTYEPLGGREIKPSVPGGGLVFEPVYNAD